MKLHIEITEKELRALVYAEMRRLLGDLELKEADIKIEVKSSQNYKSEWETANFRAVVDKS